MHQASPLYTILQKQTNPGKQAGRQITQGHHPGIPPRSHHISPQRTISIISPKSTLATFSPNNLSHTLPKKEKPP
jgi:hypothetical protein